MSQAQRTVEGAIKTLAAELRGGVDRLALESVISKIQFGEPLDYGSEWQAFTASYLLVNYRKMVIAARPLTFGATDVVVDAGCGVGAAALAFLTVLAELDRPGPKVLHLVDRSPAQLATADRLVRGVLELLGMDTSVCVVESDLRTYDLGGGPSVVLMSHVLGEQDRREADGILNRLGVALSPRGSLLAIERGDDNPWAHYGVSSVHGCEVDEGSFVASAPKPLEPDQERGWQSRWLLATRYVDWMAALVDSYFASWNNQAVEDLRRIFVDDAVYQEKPFDPPMRGLREIEDYWRSRVLPQIRPIARATSVRFGQLSAAVEWTAAFEEAGSDRLVRGQMQMYFDPHHRRIRALHEVFRAKTRVAR